MWSELGSLALEHLYLVVISILIAGAIAIPSGILLTRRPTWRRFSLGLANVFQTIPSLALFGILIPLTGIGKITATVALVAYAILPILRNTLLGITGIDSAVRESAVAVGMTPRQILFEVELPLAAHAILGGLRLATVATIGTATIAAAIGAGGLGVLIFRGIASVDNEQILYGAIPAAVMAILADEGFGWIERKFAVS
jgi:osmoprotectant transport system permease protein